MKDFDIIMKNGISTQGNYIRFIPKWFMNNYKFFIAIILTALLLLSGLGLRAMHKKSEARTSLVAREMLHSGNWLIPILNEELRLEKPPLYYWLICIASQFNGNKVSDTTARLPSALSGIFLVLLVYFWALKYQDQSTPGDSWIGVVSAGMLLSSPIFLGSARLSEIDTPLALFTSFSTYCIWRILYNKDKNMEESKSSYLWICCYLSVSLAFLLKGPIGIIIPFLPLLFVIRKPVFRIHRFKIHLLGIAIFLLIVLPWFIYILKVVGQQGSGTFLEEIKMRFSSGAIHTRPFYYYIGIVLGMFPILSIPLPFALIRWWKEKNSPADRYLIWAFMANLIFFAILSSKRARYIIPLFPFAAIILGWWITKIKFSTKAVKLFLQITIWCIIFISLVLSIMVPAYILLAGILILAADIIISRYRKIPNPIISHTLFILGAFYIIGLAYFLQIEPRLTYYHGEKPFAKRIVHILPSDAKIYSYKNLDPVLLNYLPEGIKKVDNLDLLLSEAGKNCYLISDDDLEELEKNPNLEDILSKHDQKKPKNEFTLFCCCIRSRQKNFCSIKFSSSKIGGYK